MPPRLPEQRPSRSTPPGQTPPTIALALLMCLVFGGGFFGLLAVIFPGAGMMGLVIMLLGLFFVAQYFIWGRRLYEVAVRLEKAAEERNKG